jgi:hypothetical protein
MSAEEKIVLEVKQEVELTEHDDEHEEVAPPPEIIDDAEDEELETETTTLRTKTRRDELLDDAENNSTLISNLFPRSPRAIGKRRYLMVICAGFTLTAFFTFLFVSYFVVSVEPIHLLSDKTVYQERRCLVLSQNLHHDVTVGLGSTWRGELTVRYNMTAGVETPMVATVHELVTGQLGYQTTALQFLRRADHQIGTTFPCLVDVANLPYFAAPVSPTQEVARSVIASMTIIMIIDVMVTFLAFRSLYNFYIFARYYTWNADQNVWIVTGHGNMQQAMLPP